MSFGDLERNVPSRSANNPSYRPTNSSNLSSAQPFSQASSAPRQYGAAPVARGGDFEYLQLNEKVANSIYQLNATTQQIVRLSDRIGTKRDTADTREELHRTFEAGTDIVKATNVDLKRLGNLHTENPSDASARRAQLSKLQNNFQSALMSFQNAQQAAAGKSRDFVARARAASRDASADIEDEPPRYQDSDPLLRQQQQQRSVTLDMEIQTNEQVIAEREQDIREIEAAIVEVNEIFRDLGTMVAEQGTMINDIERNTEGAAVTIQRANKELGEAQKSQKKSRAKLCWILGIVIVLAGGVVALVLLVK